MEQTLTELAGKTTGRVTTKQNENRYYDNSKEIRHLDGSLKC